MKSYLIVVLALITLGCTTGNHDLATKARSIDGFTKIENATSVPVKVTEGGAFAVSVEIDSNLESAFATERRGDTLYIHSKGWIIPSQAAQVTVQLPLVNEVTASGSGEVAVSGGDTRHNVSLVSTGSAQVLFDGTVDAATVKASGSGGVELTGTGTSLDVDLSGSASVDAHGLPVTNATLNNSGSGNISATVNDGSVSCNLSGSGSIRWSGTATVASSRKTGSGSITHE
jgi:hypothetical protein